MTIIDNSCFNSIISIFLFIPTSLHEYFYLTYGIFSPQYSCFIMMLFFFDNFYIYSVCFYERKIIYKFGVDHKFFQLKFSLTRSYYYRTQFQLNRIAYHFSRAVFLMFASLDWILFIEVRWELKCRCFLQKIFWRH